MPAERTEKVKGGMRQTTLDGKPAPAPSSSSTSSSKKKKSKSSIERVYTDVLLTIRPEFTDLIAKREKNHEYRVYKLRETVVRMWLYASTPTSAITHVMETTLPKTPGQVCDSSGIGNDEFDRGEKKSKFGYPVLGLYRLKTPLDADGMKKYGIMPPQGYMYVPKAMFDALPLDSEAVAEKLF